MKISEITDKNTVWMEMNNVDTDRVKDIYNFLVNSLPLLIKLKSPSRSKLVLQSINEFNLLVDKILNISFPDKDDNDIVTLKNELLDMKQHILSLKSQLTV